MDKPGYLQVTIRRTSSGEWRIFWNGADGAEGHQLYKASQRDAAMAAALDKLGDVFEVKQ